MRKISYSLVVGILTATIVFVGCKKKPDPTPCQCPPPLGQFYHDHPAPATALDTPLVVTSTMTTSNGGYSGTALASLNVTTSTGKATIRLDVTSTVDVDRIYIMKSEDNGTLSSVLTTADIITSAAGTFSGGHTDYTYGIPGSTKTFVLDIPVTVRTTTFAVSDVYYVWITNGIGSFLKPTKNTVLGPAIITLNYTAAAVTSYATGTATLGDQSNTSYGSLLVTSGQISALNTTDYVDAPNSADLSFSALNSAGTTKTNGSGILWLVSPSIRSTLGYAGCTTCGPGGAAVPEPTIATGANTTYIAAYTGDFDAATGSTLTGLSVGTATEAKIMAIGDVFMFQTAKGKKGVIKVTNYSSANGTATVSVKVLN